MTKVEYEKRLFLLPSPSLVSPTNILQSSELYGQVQSDSLFSSIKGELCRINGFLDVFAKDAFFRFIIKSRVSRAAIDDVFSSPFLRSSVFVFFLLFSRFRPGFIERFVRRNRTLTRPRSERERIINLICVLPSSERNLPQWRRFVILRRWFLVLTGACRC